ncbi:MAG: sigma-70 family RNA polymerase sigma factor [Bacteroidales bacterium]|nr:sigma-70 family RNA polymerase sigma factor [Bacteroidales bacterium]
MKPEDSERHIAYAALLREYHRNIVSFCIRSTHSREDAEDLMQEVLAALWEGIAKLRDGSTPGMVNRWLYSVMRTTRARHRRHRPPDTVPLQQLSVPTAPTDDFTETVEELLSALNPDDSKLIRLRLDGYTATEMATQTGMPKETIKKHISRAIQKMKQLYHNSHEE